MPLPWKKSRVSRISRLVADLHSPNRGNSLVVETGFPTSLIDLFVKNRDRLKKPSMNKNKNKKKQQKRCFIEEEEEELVISDPILLSTTPDSEFPPRPSYVEEKIQSPDRSKLVDQDQKIPDTSRPTTFDGKNNGLEVKEKCVLMVAVMKMFVVVILGLSTRKLAVGITLSAFALILLDHVAKRVVCFLKPCSNARQQALEPLFLRGFSLFRAIRDLLISKQAENCQDARKGPIKQTKEDDACDLVELAEEIQVLESNLDTNAPARVGVEINFDFHRWEGKRWTGVDIETKLKNLELGGIENGVLVCEEEPRRSNKITAKIIKKLVPKKLRRGKKLKNCKERLERDSDFGSEVSSYYGKENIGGFQAIGEQENDDKMDFEDSRRVFVAQLLEKADVVVVEEEEDAKLRKGNETDHGISSSRTGQQAREEVNIVKEMLEIEGKGSSDYLIICFIALMGLAGGRIMALVLTVVSCLMLKLFRTQRKCVDQ